MHDWFIQYCRAQAGYYPGMRRSRRKAEILAWEAGVSQPSRLENMVGVRHGAPGLWGGCPTKEELHARKAAAMPNLP